MRRSRGTKDACVVPDKFLSRIEVGLEGAMAAAFSHSGHLLASRLSHNIPVGVFIL